MSARRPQVRARTALASRRSGSALARRAALANQRAARACSPWSPAEIPAGRVHVHQRRLGLLPASASSRRASASATARFEARSRAFTASSHCQRMPASPRADTRTTAAVRAAGAGCRRHHRQARSQGGTGRATIASPPRNRRRSSATAVAES